MELHNFWLVLLLEGKSCVKSFCKIAKIDSRRCNILNIPNSQSLNSKWEVRKINSISLFMVLTLSRDLVCSSCKVFILSWLLSLSGLAWRNVYVFLEQQEQSLKTFIYQIFHEELWLIVLWLITIGRKQLLLVWSWWFLCFIILRVT